MSQPQIVSDWAPADRTPNHLELALTDQMVKSAGAGTDDGQHQLCALRNTHDANQVLYVTPGEIRSLARSLDQQDSPTSRILASATSGGQRS